MTRPRSIALLLAATVAVAAGCRSPDDRPGAAAVAPTAAGAPVDRLGADIVPRTYAVPPGRAAEVRRLVHSMSYPIMVVSASGAQTQFVPPEPAFTSDGHFVVALPTAYHAAVEQLLAELAKTPAPAGPTAYDLTFWVVRADAAATTSVAPDLKEIEPTLQALAGLGGRAYRGIDRVSSSTVEGKLTTATGRTTEIAATLARAAEGMTIQLDLRHQVARTSPESASKLSLMATVPIAVDQPVVIGDAAQPGAATGDGPAALLLYVVRARPIH